MYWALRNDITWVNDIFNDPISQEMFILDALFSLCFSIGFILCLYFKYVQVAHQCVIRFHVFHLLSADVCQRSPTPACGLRRVKEESEGAFLDASRSRKLIMRRQTEKSALT